MTETDRQRSLWIIAIVAIVNSLGYGIIIPFLYTYSERFGLGPLGSGMLFASFSLAQFLSTPIIGRLSDRFGRKILLAYSEIGTALSFFLFAIASSAPFLFAARLMDGVSGGNISVAQAVISDLTKPHERAKWFGVLGASFGFGFIVGPALGGLLTGISSAAPFWVASIVSIVATVLVILVMKESLPQQNRQPSTRPYFDLASLWNALFQPYIGLLLLVSFIVTMGFSMFILGFQVFTNDVLNLSPRNIALLFAVYGSIGLPMQGYVVGKVSKKITELPLLLFGLCVCIVGYLLMSMSRTLPIFMISSVFFAIGNAFLAPMIASLLSKHTKAEDQGGIAGINQAYASLANIAGPIAGGMLASLGPSYAFVGAACVFVLALYVVMILRRERGPQTLEKVDL